MFMRSSSLSVASFLVVVALTATAAPARHASRHGTVRHHAASGSVLIVRGDQVSTKGLVNAVAKAFAATGDGHLVVQPFNTIDGIDQALSGQVDMAASARPAYPERRQEAGLTFTPVAWDALVLITNVSNPVRNLTLRQVHDIYYGKITNWSEVGGADEHIDLEGVFPKLDGVQFSFRRLLFGNGDGPVAVPRLLINIDSLQSDVSLDGKALALSTLAHARGQKDIKIIPIEGVQPSVDSVASGQYPLPLTIYLAYKPDTPKLAQIRQFLAFLGGHEAGAILRGHDLLPYTQATVLNASTEADRINGIGARMVAEGLPRAYAPGYEFARLTGKYPELEHAIHQQAIHPQAIRQQAMPQQAMPQQALPQQQSAVAMVARADAPPLALGKDGGSDSAPIPGQAGGYTVVSGDTLPKIAHKHSVSVEELRKWNHLHGDLLEAGQVLKVSSPDP